MPVTEDKKKLLIVEDDLDVAEMLDAYFRVQGYGVTTVNWGLDAIEACHQKHPDLIILDIRLPDIDGYEVAQRLRSTERTKNIPIIFLTEKRSRRDKLLGLELGAEDYITKPFDIQELRLRVKNVLQRSGQGAINNPITGLPESILVNEKLSECLQHSDWALLLISLENIQDYREGYGFVAFDDMLRAVTMMITNAVRKEGNASDFIGHLNHHQILVVTHPETIDSIQKRLESRFKQSIDYFYPMEDDFPKQKDGGKRLSLDIKRLSLGSEPYKDVQSIKNALMKA